MNSSPEKSRMEMSVRSKVTQNSVTKFKTKISNTLKVHLASLSAWFQNQVLYYDDPCLERLTILETSVQVMIEEMKQPKRINQIFLEIASIKSLIQKSMTLLDIAFILKTHNDLKVKKEEIIYDGAIYETLKDKVEALIMKNRSKTDVLMRVVHVDNFLYNKDSSPDMPFQMRESQRENNEKEVIYLFNYVFRPLLQKKSVKNIHSEMQQMVKWLIIIKDDTIEKQKLLLQIVRKLDSYLMVKKTEININFMGIMYNIFDIVSVKYLREDPFTCATLAPLCNVFRNQLPFREIINNWLDSKKKSKNKAKNIENVFRNLIGIGSVIFAFNIINNFSHLLQTLRDYETLYHLFDTVIKRDLLTLRLHNESFLNFYLQILLMYTVGFINRDRLDGETQLDALTENLQIMAFKKDFGFDKNYRLIIMFYAIYENRFQGLTPTAKRFVRNLQDIYQYRVSNQLIYQEIERRIFKDLSMDYNDDDLQVLQRSQRYLGLQNLGNTCYMNSFMQALFMTKKFKSLVLRAKDQGAIQSSKTNFYTLAHLFTDLDEKGYNKKYEVNPLYFKQTTPEPFKSSWQQHDSGQFGRMYFDMIVSQLKGNELSTKLEKLFTHKIKNLIICQKCKNERQKIESIFDFILHFNENAVKSVKVSDIMKKNFEGFELDQSNALYCERCRTRTTTLNIPYPIQFASHLIVTISIFKFEGLVSSKITTPINLQFILNTRSMMPQYTGDNIAYQLYAFIVHIGTGVQKGHYKCFARNLQENPMVWYEFDDHYVTEREINKFEDFRFGQKQNPYILFYCNYNKGNRISVSSPLK